MPQEKSTTGNSLAEALKSISAKTKINHSQMKNRLAVIDFRFGAE